MLYRSVVPASSLPNTDLGSIVEYPTPHDGAPYGFPWSDIVKEICLDGEVFEQEMYKMDLWTLEDAQKGQSKISVAIQTALSVMARDLLNKAYRLRKGE